MERLPPQPWMTAPSARAVIDALEAVGGKGCARFVGGCVRDTLLGRGAEVTDVDIATPLTPPQVTAALQAAGLKAVPTGVEHGTITAVSDGKPYEITTLRRDVETDGRRAVVAFTSNWDEDAQRRDFRLNALYADPDGTLHDPTGGGLADVAARRIVFVGDPETRIREDYLRILRFFRFLARVGSEEVDEAGLQACQRLRSGLGSLSGERVQRELFKLLGSPEPLFATFVMVVMDVLSPLLPTAGLLIRLEGLLEVQAALGEKGDPLLRLRSLMHDSALGQDGLDQLPRRLRLSRADRERFEGMTLPFRKPRSARASRRVIYELGADRVGDLARLSWAWDRSGVRAEAERWRPVVELARTWSPPPFPVTGAEIKALGVPEGPEVGEVRRALEAWWVKSDFTATKAQAIAKLKRLAPSFREDRR